MIELYINGHKLDMNDSVSIALTYSVSDADNPTATKNAFTKSITVQGTSTNNQIFENIWRLDNSETKFDAKQRVDAVLCENGNIIHKGYVQMNSIQHINGTTNYSMTFYGNTGNFFYSLMYNDEGEELTLADMYYHFQSDADDHTYTKEEEDRAVLADWESYYIINSWDNITNSARTETDMHVDNWVTSAPLYKGFNDDFDSNKILVNTYFFTQGMWDLFPTVNSGQTATTKGSFLLCEAERDMDEWEMLDLRSSRQRPTVKNSLILDAISRAENNGGYTVDWDNEFKNSVYYKNTWAIFPQIEFEEKREVRYKALSQTINLAYVDYRNRWTEQWLTNESTNTTYFDTSALYNPTIDLNYIPSVSAHTNIDKKHVIFNFSASEKINNDITPYINLGGIGFYVEVYDGNTIYRPREYYFYTNTVRYFGGLKYKITDYIQHIRDRMGLQSSDRLTVKTFEEQLTKLDNMAQVYTLADAVIKAKAYLPQSHNTRIKVGIGYFAYSQYGYTSNESHPHLCFNNGDPQEYATLELLGRDAINVLSTTKTDNGVYDGNTDRKNTNVTKKMLFGDTSPFNYLVDFCKMFHLKIFSDEFNKKIYIRQTKNYYQDKIFDINDKIDYNKGYTIKPQIAEKKWMQYGLNAEDGNYAEYLYSKRNKIPYGAYKLNTHTNFNNEIEKPFEDNTFKESIPYLLQSQYFETDKIKIGTSQYNYPSVALMQKYTVTSYSGGSDYEIVKYGYSNNHSIPKLTDPYSPKLCMFDKENSSVGNGITLAFLNGEINQEVLVSDYFPMMEELNGNECYVLSPRTINAKDSEGQTFRVGYKSSYYPYFSTYMYDGNGNMTYSLDFSEPTQLFNGETQYTDRTVYNQFWKNQQEDYYSRDTIQVELYCFLPMINLNDMFRQFYTFEGNVWILQQISDWQINPNIATKCTFVKVQNKSNYLS